MNRRCFLGSAAVIMTGGVYSSARSETGTIHIQFQRFSAFYAPLIATIAGKYLEAEGLTPSFTTTPAGKSSLESLTDGSADVAQYAPGLSLLLLEKGLHPTTAHFAQINERDGFFLLGKVAEPNFYWPSLKGRKVLINYDTQPFTMFRYACFKRGCDFRQIDAVQAGTETTMIDAFRRGEAEFVHLQGPAAQQLEQDGVGHAVAAVGEAVGPCAFSTLAGTREWLTTDKAKRFVRAYRRARSWTAAAPAKDITNLLLPFFAGIDPGVLTATVIAYQKLGTWSPAVEISHASFEGSVEIFRLGGLLTRSYAYGDVIVPPPV